MFKNVRNKAAMALALTAGAVGQALAEVPAEVKDAMNEGKADALTVCGLGLVIIISIAAFKYMRRGV